MISKKGLVRRHKKRAARGIKSLTEGKIPGARVMTPTGPGGRMPTKKEIRETRKVVRPKRRAARKAARQARKASRRS